MGKTTLDSALAAGGRILDKLIDAKVEGSGVACPIGPADWQDFSVRVVGAVDPNDKFGPRGATAQRYVPYGTPMNYTIDFENLPSASAPAQEVVVTDSSTPPSTRGPPGSVRSPSGATGTRRRSTGRRTRPGSISGRAATCSSDSRPGSTR